MNKLTIIGNLTRDPELRTTSAGINVCTFTVAVNRRRSSQSNNQQPEADFFRVNAWRQLGENCQKYLAKGRKVAVVGAVSVSSYEAKDDTGTRFTLEVQADDVEFLSSRSEDGAGYAPAASGAPSASHAAPAADTGFQEVD
ncbi:MAG: single-stranded DNA-binding protein, partial [Clostridia bacterium]